jgi:hypothetical protein
MKYCAEAILVGLDHELPADPAVAYSGKPPFIGCNHLVCENCGAVVRHADSRSTSSNYSPPRDELERLYESNDPASSPLLEGGPLHRESRAYFCRCDWRAVNVGGELFCDLIDQPWKCGGHQPGMTLAHDIRVAAAREAVDALVGETVPIFIPETGAKIKLDYAPGVHPEFATASELRDALLASYPDAATYGAPVVPRHRDDTQPAWGWVKDFLLMRSDWWPALGIALQHAATDGGELARTALVELLGHYSDSIALVPWTSPLAELWPDVRTLTRAATGWGRPDGRLDAIIRDQKKTVAEVRAGKGRAFLDGHGPRGEPLIGPLTNEDQLRALLVASARAGQFPDGDKGPWSWLASKLIFGDPWMRPALVHIIHTIDVADEPSVFALLDWFTEQQDLWQFVKLLEGWVAHPPRWWAMRADTKPSGWKRTIRSSFWLGVSTLGDIAVEALRRAKWQAATPPVIDLPQLYGSSIS